MTYLGFGSIIFPCNLCSKGRIKFTYKIIKAAYLSLKSTNLCRDILMDDIASSDLKTILHSKRANVFYLEYCRVMQKDGRVLYLTEHDKSNQYFNIPIANTTVILLGNGTSITQAAVRMLAKAGVLIGFSGGGGTPLFMGSEIEWMTPQSEYRPTEYLQGWVEFWFDENKRLIAAKKLQQFRIQFLQKIWSNDRELRSYDFNTDNADLGQSLGRYSIKINSVDRER